MPPLLTVGGDHRLKTGGPHPEQARRNALALLHRALDVVDILVMDVLEPTAAQDPDADQVKESAEVAMLLRLASQVDDPPMIQRSRQLARHLAPIARSPELLRRLSYRPSSSAPLALTHACLSQVGNSDEHFDAAVRSAFAARGAQSGDRTAYRILDVAWIRHLVLGDGELQNHRVLRLTCLGQGLDLIAPTTEEAYAFSHTLPYATDFGRLPLPGWVDLEEQSQTADVLIAKALVEDDLDLLGELLMTPTLLRQAWSPMQEFGWLVLTGLWARYPILPGPGIPERVGEESVLTERRRVLGTVYHTSLVGGLMLATTLNAGTPPATMTEDVDVVAGQPAWQSVWAALDPADRDRLAVAPLLISLHRYLTDVDLAAMLGVLRDPGAGSLPNGLVEQSVELMLRVAALD